MKILKRSLGGAEHTVNIVGAGSSPAVSTNRLRVKLRALDRKITSIDKQIKSFYFWNLDVSKVCKLANDRKRLDEDRMKIRIQIKQRKL